MTRRIYKPRFDKWQVGDRLWVRETYLEYIPYDDNGDLSSDTVVAYRADEDDPKTIEAQLAIDAGRDSTISYGVEDTESERMIHGWQPSIFMRRELSRITLEITELKRERLQDISEADAEREGCGKYDTGDYNVIPSFRSGFKHVFETINGRGSWKQNPEVLAIGFKVLEVRKDKRICSDLDCRCNCPHSDRKNEVISPYKVCSWECFYDCKKKESEVRK